MRKSGLLFLASVLGGMSFVAALATSAQAGQLPVLPHSQPEAAFSPLLPAKSKCKLKVVCDYFAPASSCKHPPCCKKWHVEKVCEPKEKTTTPDSKASPAQPDCPLGKHTDTGMCICPPGQVNHVDGSCGRPCGYGMSGTPPKCRCVTGATLQVTGPSTKGCLCPDGKPPKEVDGNYACQNLGPQ